MMRIKTVRRRLPARSARLLSLLLSLAVPVSACNRDASARAEQAMTPAKVSEVSDSSLIAVRHPEQFPVATVVARSVADRLGGTCVVTPDVNRTVPVNALGGGRVVAVNATLGDAVRKGQPLVTISSPDLSSALADHLKAMADERFARGQLERARLLFDHGTIAKKDLEAADNAEQRAMVDLHATEEHVRLLGGDPTQPSPLIELKAPIDGTIISQNVTPAAGVKSPDNAPNLFTIADLSRVWVLCDVYENDLSRARVGDRARIRLNSFPDSPLGGRIGNISPILDSTTRTAKVRIEMDNAGGVMRPGMFAVAELEAPARDIRLVLPTTALVQLHDADWVFVKTGPTTFRRVQVRGGREIEPGLQEILSGVTAGQQVVRNALPFTQTVGQ
jgi:cobalt-zinc-cadmium efflux system membrane fusion protein